MTPEAKTRPLDIAVVRFPGTNCDFDTLKFFQRGGHNPRFLWYKDSTPPQADLLVLAGGFAFGDRVYEKATHSYRLKPGLQALNTPVMEVVRSWTEQGRPILGICNGFQILVHTRILPGILTRNEHKKFFCDDVDCAVEGRSFFNSPQMLGNVYRINIAHGFGLYSPPFGLLEELEDNQQIFLRYHGINPNGSFDNIAGVCNKDGNIFGMMPHPERTDEATRRVFLEAIENYVRERI